MGVKKFQEENIKVLMENHLLKVIMEKISFFWHDFCPRTLDGSKEVFFFPLILSKYLLIF
jgi:hypothetical protein